MSTGVAVVSLWAHRHEEALLTLTRVRETEARFPPVHYYMGLTLERLGRIDEAVASLERAIAMSLVTLSTAALAHMEGRRGRTERALELQAALAAAGKERWVSPYAHMLARLGVGDLDGALACLEEALRERVAWLTTLPLDPRAAPLLDDPRGAALCERLGLPTAPTP